jgi:hypothetical protein
MPTIIWTGFRALSAAGVFLLAGRAAYAQATTGNIEGQVTDSVGNPLVDAQVFIVGTASAALTDPRGHYFINHVPPGYATLRAVYVGYRPVEVRQVRVLTDQTVTQDFTLDASAVRLLTLEVVGADTRLVPRDEVTTIQRVQGDFLEQLPVDRLNQLLALQPGVIATGQEGPLALSIRGGRPDEAVTYVDGVPVTPGYRGLGLSQPGVQIGVGTNAVEEASIITGGASAEFGNTQSGVVSIITRSGGNRISGGFGIQTDEPFGVNRSLGFNRLEASLGGPLADRLSFFLAGVLEGRQSAAVGKESEKAPIFVPAGLDTTVAVPSQLGNPVADTTYVPIYRMAVSRGECQAFSRSVNPGIQSNYGISCQGIRTPRSGSSLYEFQSKLNYTYGRGSWLVLSYLRSQNQGREFNYENLYASGTLFGNRTESDVVSLNSTHNLMRTAERALVLELYLSYQRDRAIASPLTAASEQASRDPFGGFMIGTLDFLFDFDNFPLNQELVENVRLNQPGSRRSPYDLENASQYDLVDQYRNNPYALEGWSEGGGPVGTLQLFRERRYVGRANLDWQANRFNRVRLGTEVVRHSLEFYRSDLQNLGDAYLEFPVRWDVFAENRLDLGDVVLVGGIRYDSYSSRASRPFLLDTVAASETFGQYLNLPGAPFYGDGGTFRLQRQDGVEDLPLVIYRPDETHGYLSPHVQVSFPISTRTNFRLSYAHQVQAPDLGLILTGVNNGGSGSDLDFGRTITFEFGARHAFSDDMVVDVAVYNRDNLANASARTFVFNDPRRQARIALQRVTTADFGNTRGIDIRLDRRIAALFNGTISYSHQTAKNTSADPFENRERAVAAINEVAGITGPPPQAILPTALSRPHDLAGAVSLAFPADWKQRSIIGVVLRNLGLFATFRYASGTAYTPCPRSPANAGSLSGSGCAELTAERNSTRLPAFKQFDLRVTKGFALGRVDLTAYLDIRNLFNFTNFTQVFSTTGTPQSPEEEARAWESDSISFSREADESRSYRWENGSIDLSFANEDGIHGCQEWVTASRRPAAPNCVYLIRAEERYGNGDRIFTAAEQRRASEAYYLVRRGLHTLTDEPRQARIGIEVTF